MTTATTTKKRGEGERMMLSVMSTPEANSLLNKLKRETGMSKRLIVLLGLHAFDGLNANQRAELNKKNPIGA